MRIGFFTNSYIPTINGVVRSLVTAKDELERKGHSVYIFYATRKFFDKELRPLGRGTFPYRSIAIENKSNVVVPITWFADAVQYARSWQLDIIHSHHPAFVGTEGQKVAKSLGIPLVFTYHSEYDQYSAWAPGNLLKTIAANHMLAMARTYIQGCDGVVAPSAAIKDFLLAHHVDKPIAVIPTGIPLSRNLVSDKRKNAALRRRWGLADTDFVLLSVSRLSPEKNISLLLRAFAEVQRIVLRVRLVIVGTGILAGRLKDEAKELGIADAVRFVGAVRPEEVYRYYDFADLFAYSSRADTQALVLAEAASRGLAIVTVRNTGTASFIIDGLNGIMVNPSEEDFAAAIIRLAQDDVERSRLAQQGKVMVRRYSAAASADKLIEFYGQIIAASSSGVPLPAGSFSFAQNYEADRL